MTKLCTKCGVKKDVCETSSAEFDFAQVLVCRGVAEYLCGEVLDGLGLLVEFEVHLSPVRSAVPDGRAIAVAMSGGLSGSGMCQLRIALGMPRPNIAMRSLWISFVPPPKVSIRSER